MICNMVPELKLCIISKSKYMKPEIREAEKEDLEGVLDLYALPDMDNGKRLKHDEALKIFSKMKNYPWYKLFIAIDPEKRAIIGTYTLLVADNLVHLGMPSAYVESVIVAPAYRSAGVGKAMMEHARNLCRDAGCSKMALSSRLSRDRAHAFYEKLGFKKHGYSFYMEIDEE